MKRQEEGRLMEWLALQSSSIVIIDEEAASLMFTLAQAGLTYREALALACPS